MKPRVSEPFPFPRAAAAAPSQATNNLHRSDNQNTQAGMWRWSVRVSRVRAPGAHGSPREEAVASFLPRLTGKTKQRGDTVLPCNCASCWKNVWLCVCLSVSLPWCVCCCFFFFLPSFNGSRVMATLSLPLPRLTRWGVAVWTFNPLPVSMRSRGGDCKHQLDGKFSNTLNRERFAFVRYCAGRQEKEFMIISTSKAPTLSAFLVVYSSSWASAVQFCLRGDEGGFLVSPENCTFTASGENHLASCLKKKQTLGPSWHHTSTELQVSAHALYWEVEQTKGRKWRAFLVSGKLATHTVIIKHWTFKC